MKKFLLLGMFCLSAWAKPIPKLPADAMKIPVIPQGHSYSCGAATMLAIFTYWDLYDGNESSLFKMLNTTPDYGTDPINMYKLGEEFGLESEYITFQTLEMVEQRIKDGWTVILDFQAWADVPPGTDVDWPNRWEDGHYSIVIGMDKNFIYFMDPSSIGRYAYIPRNEFYDRWHDYEIRGKNNDRIENKQLAIYFRGDAHVMNVPAKMIPLE